MWLLKNESKSQVYKIKIQKENIVSRKEGDLLLSDDQSISRKHAVLTFNEHSQKIILKDLGSKYGTSIKKKEDFKKVSANEEVEVNSGDVIRFGIQANLWILEYFPLVVSTSTLGQEEKTEVKQIVSALNGTVVSKWNSQCTHLVMNRLTVTVKVVCALAEGRCIVTPQYWRNLHQCVVSMQLPLPESNDFLPELIEATLDPNEVSFTPNPLRKNLFSGTTFVASTPRQLDRIEMMITAAGGKVQEFSSSKADINDYLNKNTILIMHSALDRQTSQESQIPTGYKAIARMLKNQGMRCIPEPEIGLSILFCSLEQYCNPRFKSLTISQCGDSCLQSKGTSEIMVAPQTMDQKLKISGTKRKMSESCSTLLKETQKQSTSNKKRICEKEPEEIPKQKRSCKKEDEDLFALPLPKPETRGNMTQHNRDQPSRSRSPDLFSVTQERDRDIFSGVTSENHSKSGDLFNFQSVNISNKKSDSLSNHNSSKRSGTDMFSLIIEKNKHKKSEDNFMFPSERRENQLMPEKNKRSRNEESEFEFPSDLDNKRLKLHGAVNSNKSGSSIDSSDPFNFPEKVLSSRRKTSNKSGLWDLILDEQQKDNAKRVEREKTAHILSDDDDDKSQPEIKEANEATSFQICFDEEIKKEPPKPIPLSSFITKPSIKKEVTEDEEELSNQFNETIEIRVKSLVISATPVREILPQRGQQNIINFKKFKKQCGLAQRLPFIIGGSDLIPHEV